MSYDLVYASSTTYKVNVSYTANGTTTPATIWSLKDGTILALYADGRNYTNGERVTEYLSSLLAPIAIYHGFGNEVNSSSPYFYSTGSSTMTIGPNSLTVTNYTSNAPNVAIPSCDGYSYLLTTYDMSIGTPAGSNFEIIPYMEIAGSDTNPSGTATFTYVIQITAFTVG